VRRKLQIESQDVAVQEEGKVLESCKN
jgi:hypothetical protein